jgi:hypothetical protein
MKAYMRLCARTHHNNFCGMRTFRNVLTSANERSISIKIFNFVEMVSLTERTEAQIGHYPVALDLQSSNTLSCAK